MNRSRSLVVALAALFLAGACANQGGGGWNADPLRCAVVGGALGGGGGAGAANARHSDDDTQDYAVGAAVGIVGGAALGWFVCAATRGEQRPPSAQAAARPSSGTAPLDVDLRGSGTDPDGRVVGFRWEFGDGATADQRNTRHVYREPGTYTARLTVTDDQGLHATDQVRITVEPARAALPPPPEPPRVERRIVLRGVQFAFNMARIEPAAEIVLDEAANVIQENPDVRIEVAGHTDSVGSETYNQSLSERRARAVRLYLVSHGVDSDRLVVRGYGESQPVADNGNPDGRAENRRVELNVLR